MQPPLLRLVSVCCRGLCLPVIIRPCARPVRGVAAKAVEREVWELYCTLCSLLGGVKVKVGSAVFPFSNLNGHIPGVLGRVWDWYLPNCGVSFVLYGGQGEHLLLSSLLGKRLKVALAQTLRGQRGACQDRMAAAASVFFRATTVCIVGFG